MKCSKRAIRNQELWNAKGNDMRTGEVVLNKIIRAIMEVTSESDIACIVKTEDSIIFHTAWIDKDKLYQALEEEFNI